jgi:hypothetical protein
MNLHRFREQLNAFSPTPGPTPVLAAGAFVAFPLAVQCVGVWADLYQLAFLQAQAAHTDPRDLFAVLN